MAGYIYFPTKTQLYDNVKHTSFKWVKRTCHTGDTDLFHHTQVAESNDWQCDLIGWSRQRSPRTINICGWCRLRNDSDGVERRRWDRLFVFLWWTIGDADSRSKPTHVARRHCVETHHYHEAHISLCVFQQHGGEERTIVLISIITFYYTSTMFKDSYIKKPSQVEQTHIDFPGSCCG